MIGSPLQLFQTPLATPSFFSFPHTAPFFLQFTNYQVTVLSLMCCPNYPCCRVRRLVVRLRCFEFLKFLTIETPLIPGHGIVCDTRPTTSPIGHSTKVKTQSRQHIRRAIHRIIGRQQGGKRLFDAVGQRLYLARKSNSMSWRQALSRKW